MFAQSPFTNLASSRKARIATRVDGKRVEAGGSGLVRSGFMPQTLVLVGLAIAIACWGFGYRLSSYQLHPTSTAQTAAAKLCVEPRNSTLAAASHLSVTPHLADVELPRPSKLNTLSYGVSGSVHAGSPDSYRSTAFHFLIPFRSPPPQRFLA